jgi:GAF domain-containing protein
VTDDSKRLADRYERVAAQLRDLFANDAPRLDPVARMAAAAALLHHKMPHFFWTGFYRLIEGDLVVGPYQGPIACNVLARHEGVCWACVDRNEPIVVEDVHSFPGHIACDSRSQSEVVVPIRDASGRIVAVLDVDSDRPAAFTAVDAEGLTGIAALIAPR